VEKVPVADYKLPMCIIKVIKLGKDVSILGYESPIYVLENTIQLSEKKKHLELIVN
ncbi:hypothetical protein BJ944DRAFT_167627, partial [Cunninghamella echinulata]